MKSTGTAFALLLFFIQAAPSASKALDEGVQRLCQGPGRSVQVVAATDASSQEAAVARNEMMRSGTIVAGNPRNGAWFSKKSLLPGDCVDVRHGELLRLRVRDEEQADRPAPSAATSARTEEGTFLPVVVHSAADHSKQFGLLARSMLDVLVPSRRRKDAETSDIMGYFPKDDNDLVVVCVTCPADRNGLCDLRIKQRKGWMIDPETGRPFGIKVLARARRERGGPEQSRRISINSDTPQGIYHVWGAVVGGGTSAWHRLARIDLDAALPPVNGRRYNENAFVLSQIVPDHALDDYWINEWPLAHSLGRVFLRMAPGGFEAKQGESGEPLKEDAAYAETEGCISTGSSHEKLLKALVRAGVFAADEVFGRLDASEAKKWSVSPKLGRAFVVVKDR